MSSAICQALLCEGKELTDKVLPVGLGRERPNLLLWLLFGTHFLGKPWERMTSQLANVDWFAFWLKGEENPDPAKAEQYKRWRKLRKLQEENETKHKEIGSAPIH